MAGDDLKLFITVRVEVGPNRWHTHRLAGAGKVYVVLQISPKRQRGWIQTMLLHIHQAVTGRYYIIIKPDEEHLTT